MSVGYAIRQFSEHFRCFFFTVCRFDYVFLLSRAAVDKRIIQFCCSGNGNRTIDDNNSSATRNKRGFEYSFTLNKDRCCSISINRSAKLEISNFGWVLRNAHTQSTQNDQTISIDTALSWPDTPLPNCKLLFAEKSRSEKEIGAGTLTYTMAICLLIRIKNQDIPSRDILFPSPVCAVHNRVHRCNTCTVRLNRIDCKAFTVVRIRTVFSQDATCTVFHSPRAAANVRCQALCVCLCVCAHRLFAHIILRQIPGRTTITPNKPTNEQQAAYKIFDYQTRRHTKTVRFFRFGSAARPGSSVRACPCLYFSS